MRKLLRWTGYLVGIVLLLVLIVALAIWAISARKLSATVEAKPERLIPMQQASLEEGQRLLFTRACTECHGTDLRGTKFADVPPKVATLYAPNLTVIAKEATDQQLAQAIRQGIGHDGRPLIVMPSESYANFTDAETTALIKAIRAVPVGGERSPPLKLGPIGRIGVAAGEFKTAPELIEEYAAAMPADLGPKYAAGRHIALTVCSGCHGPSLSGREPQPGLKAPDLSVAGAYDLPAFTKLMREGVPPNRRPLKMRTNVSQKSFSHFTDEEIGALHSYLVERAKRAP